MSFDFPSSPTNGQQYTSGGKTFVFNGYAWDPQSSGNFVAKTGDTMTGALTTPAVNVTGGGKLQHRVYAATYHYTALDEPGGAEGIIIGDISDPANYYYGDTHYFATFAEDSPTTTMLTINETKVDVSQATPSTSPTTGALTVAGGAGIGGRLSLGSTLYMADTQPFVMGSGAQIYGQGATYIQRSDTFGWYNAAASVQFGTWTAGGLTIGSGSIYSPSFNCNPAPSVIAGGMSNSGGADGFTILNDGSNRNNVFLGGTAGTNTNHYRNTTHAWQGIAGTPAFGQLDATGLQVLPTTASTTPTTGALKVSGGAGISGALNTGGNIIAGGQIFPSTINNLGLTAYLQSMYIGVAFGDALNIDTDAANKWAIFTLGGNQPLIVQGKTGAQKVFPNNDNLTALGQPAQRWSNFYAMAAAFSSTTASSSSTTGALTVAGGVGIALDLNVGGRVAAGSLLANTSVGAFGANNAALDVSGGQGRLMAFGANASTKGQLSVLCYSSDASISTVSAIFSGAGLHVPGNVGFYGTAPVAKPTVSGSLAGNAALTSLIAALAGMGLITNSTGP